MAQDLQQLPAPHAELARYIADHPDTPINDIIQPYRTYEAQLRSVFAQDRQHPLLEDPHVNLCPLFTNDTKDITIRARDLASESQEEKDRYIMPLPEEKRRAHGSPAVVATLADFRRNFSIFSESSLADLDWNNVVAAGSSVVNTLLPVPPEFNTTKRKLREYYHEKFCPASDVDLFLYGLTHDEALGKIKQIEKAIRDSILTEVTVVRTKYAITIASQYPTRHVQIVLRVYKSVGEILTGFDIDAAGGAYDGKQVWVTPRALGSFITQINHIDLTRRSPSYENRLSKYSHRNFEVYWPELDRSRVDPTIFERSFQRTLGLARLLVLERLPTSTVRETYLSKRREERGRPALNRNYMHRLHGNIKDQHEDEVADWVNEQDVSNYHTFTVPYGAHFHAKKVEKLCYTRDLLLNAEWNQPKEREVYLHRHPAFFGRVEDVIEDCCGSCPKPVTPEEIEVAEKEAEIYISGKVSFLIDDPGRQQIGSFNPLTEDDWTDMAYVGNTARLCQSIVDGDVDEVVDWLSQEGADPNKRDYTGRTPLHLAVISSTAEVVRTLVAHGARLTARLADGMTALHLAAESGDAEMVKILMEKSEENENEEMEKQDRRRQAQQGSSKEQAGEKDEQTDSEDEESDGELIDGEETEADVLSMATGSFVKVEKSEEAQAEVDLDANSEEPDFYKSDVLAWDIPCSPLHLAIAQGHEDIVALLHELGSDALLPVKFLNSDKQPTGAILTLALALVLPLEKAQSMAKLLLRLGATSSQADFNGCTALHRYIQSGQEEMVDVLWANDKAAVKTAINHIVCDDRNYYDDNAMGPLHTAIEAGDGVLVLKLLEAGANPVIDFDSWLKAVKFTKVANRLGDFENNKKIFGKSVEQPVIFAAKNCPDPTVALELLERGADPNTITATSAELLGDEWRQRYNRGQTLLDLVRFQLSSLRKYKGETTKSTRLRRPDGMQEQLDEAPKGSYEYWMTANDIRERERALKKQEENEEAEEKKRAAEQVGIEEKKAAIKEIIEGFEKLEKAVVDKGGKSFYDIYPEVNKPSREYNNYDTTDSVDADAEEAAPVYLFDITFWGVTDVTNVRKPAYLKL
jgi:ankyrin repeat protein